MYPVLLPGLALTLGALVIADFMRWSSLAGVALSIALIAWLDSGIAGIEVMPALAIFILVAVPTQAWMTRLKHTLHRSLAWLFFLVVLFFSKLLVTALAWNAVESWQRDPLGPQMSEVQALADQLVLPEHRVKLVPDSEPDWIEPWENAILTGRGEGLLIGAILRPNGTITIIVEPKALTDLGHFLSPMANQRKPFGAFRSLNRTATGIAVEPFQRFSTFPRLLRGRRLPSFD